MTYTEGSPGTWTAGRDTCHFTDDGGKTDMFVTQAGVIVARYTDDDGASYAVGIGLPVQTHTLAVAGRNVERDRPVGERRGHSVHRGHGHGRQ